MEREIELAKETGMGIIAMKAAMAVATQHEQHVNENLSVVGGKVGLLPG